MISLLAAVVITATSQKIDVAVDVKASEAISGIRHFKVNVASNDPVTQVEFYVGSELRDSDSSVPYEFDLDTVEEKDGGIDLTFAAYTSKGDSQKKVIAVNVDNGLGLGVAPHVEKGVDFLHDSKWDDAIQQGRIALKIDPESNPARMVMAHAYLGKGILDKAQKYAEDWHTSAPADTDASELLSGISLHRAFNTMSRGNEDRDTALKNIQDAFKSAVNTRQAVLQGKMDKIGTPTADNLIEFADSAISARRYSIAIQALQEPYRTHVERTDVTNRLAYAQFLSGRKEDALTTLRQVQRLAKLDAYGNALMAVILSASHEQAAADKAIAEATKIDATDIGVRTAQAYMALRDRKVDVLASVCSDMLNDAGDRPEVNYYLNTLGALRGSFDDSRKYFETMIYADPLSEAGYLEEGNNALLFAVKGARADREFRAKSARAMFETALEVRPESYRALLGLAFTSLLMGQNQDGLKYANAAAKAAPTQPSALYALSAALSLNGKPSEAFNYDRLAWKYDMTVLNGRSVPKPIEAWGYYAQFDRIPVMTPPR